MKLHVFFLALSLFAATCAALESPTCPPGYMTNGTTYGACDLRECIECPMGRFSSAANSLSCEECVPPAFSNTPGAIVCVECEHGKYAAGRAPGYVQCRACPEGSKCARGEITTEAGYWGVLSLPEPPQVFHCPNEDACVGDNKCAKNREAAETNPLCGKCASGYAPTYSDSIRGYDGGCVSCSTPNVGAAVGGYLLGVAAVALLVLLEYKGKRLCAPFFAFIFFCQILEVVLSADDDKDVQEDLAVAFNAFAFPHTLRFADACVVSDSMEGLVMADMFTQLFYLSQAAVVAAVLYFVKRDALGAAKNVAVYLVFITIVPSVRAAAAPFNCKDVAGARLVRVAPAIDCDDAAGLAALGAIIMCLYVLTPIAILLRVRLGKIEPHEQLLAPFWRRNYRASAWWFFAITWGTLMLVAWAPTITTSHTPIYLSAILSLALLSHSFWLPFKANADARTAFAALLVPWLLTLMMLPGDSSSYNYSTVHSGFLLAISWLTVLVLLARTAVRMKLCCCCGQVKESDGQVDDDYYNDVQGDEESGQ